MLSMYYIILYICIIFKTGWRLWPPTWAISPARGSRLSKPIHRTHIAQPKIILLVSFSSNFEKAFCYPFPTVSDRVGLDFGIWIVMLQ